MLDSKIFYLTNQMPHRTTLLKLVAQQEQNLHSLYDYQVKGDGSLTEGIVGAISETLGGISDAGVKLIGAITKGVGSATSNVITASTTGISEILKSLGGIPVIVVFVIELLIVGYLGLDKWKRVQARGPPPLPARQVYRPCEA